MKYIEALEIIADIKKPTGFRISFERPGDGFLRGDSFPERDEPPIESIEEAWILAGLFASKTRGKCVNIYVTDNNYHPVDGYKTRQITNR